MLGNLLIALLAVAPADMASLLPLRMPAVAAVERLAVPPQAVGLSLVVDPLGRTIVLKTGRNQDLIAQKFRSVSGPICPDIKASTEGVVLRCRTLQLDARLTEIAGRRYLDIYELRGVPFRGEDYQVPVHYEPSAFHPGETCPGKTPAARGECLFKANRVVDAAIQFKLALSGEGEDTSWGALRLGDIALAQEDVGKALSWYRRAGMTDRFGRLAIARICELTGCHEGERKVAFDTMAQPEVVRGELLMRHARLAAFVNHIGELIDTLKTSFKEAPGRRCLDFGVSQCRRLVLFALEHPDLEPGMAAIEFYLDLPERDRGPYSLPMVRAAAEKAVKLGAPVFGANLLASSAAWSDQGLVEHLQRAAELYLLGNDPPRAQVIFEYVEARFGVKRVSEPRWVAIKSQLGLSDQEPTKKMSAEFEVLTKESAKDLEAAASAIAKARTVKP